MKNKLYFLFVHLVLSGVALLVSFSGMGQTEKKLIRDGNKQYEAKKYSDSEIAYRKSLEKNKQSFEGEFNLGDALYKQGKFEEATEHFSNLAAKEKDKSKLSGVYHNLGNSLLHEKKYEESINAYKNALKNAPDDKATKYNLAYAQSMLRQQQQQQQQDKNDKDKNGKDNKNQQSKEGKGDKDKDQQSQAGNKKEKKGDEKQQQSKEGDQGKEKQEQQQAGKPKEQKISKEDAERILQALNNEEKQTQKKLSKKEAQRINIEKDW